MSNKRRDRPTYSCREVFESMVDLAQFAPNTEVHFRSYWTSWDLKSGKVLEEGESKGMYLINVKLPDEMDTNDGLQDKLEARVLNGVEYQSEFGDTTITKMLILDGIDLLDMKITVFPNNVQVAKCGNSIVTMGECPDILSALYLPRRSQTATFTKRKKGQSAGFILCKNRGQEKFEPSTQTKWELQNGMNIEEDVESGEFTHTSTTNGVKWLSTTKYKLSDGGYLT